MLAVTLNFSIKSGKIKNGSLRGGGGGGGYVQRVFVREQVEEW